MNKIDWKQKLSSRKFWAALIGFITAILFAFKVAETDVTQITGIITAIGTLVIYILTEGYVDVNREPKEELPTEYFTTLETSIAEPFSQDDINRIAERLNEKMKRTPSI